MTKNKLIKEIVEMLKTPKIHQWYYKNLETAKQENTIKILETATQNKQLTIKEALSIALITGLQWEIKFEGTP